MNRGKNKQVQQGLTASTTGLQNSAASLTQQGGKLGEQAGNFLGGAQKSLAGANTNYDQAQNYFSPILRGGAAADAALAPDRAAITDTYRGAGKALENVRGGTGDLARAELNRDRAGKLALLPSTARAGAATALTNIAGGRANVGGTQAGAGVGLSGQSTAAYGGATQGYSNLFSGTNRQNEVNQAYGNQSGNAIGRMIFDAAKSGKGKASSGGGGGLTGDWQTDGIG